MLKQRTIDLIDLLKINSNRIKSWADCCGGSREQHQQHQQQQQQQQQQQPMDIEQMEMGNSRAYREPFIFGSWKRKSRRRAPPIATTVPVVNNIDACPKSTNIGNMTKRKRSDQALSESQRSSTYRPASYESSFSDAEMRRSAADPLRDEVPRAENEELDNDDFWCPRCGSRMTEPRLLTCLHPICSSCVDELLDQAPGKFCGNDPRRESSQREGYSYGLAEGCPVCDYPLPRPGSPVPPPHYPLQHRLVMDAVRRRLSHRVLCCDVCPEEVHATVHCPTCLGNFCCSCGADHQEAQDESGIGTISHQVRPLWEAKRFRRTALCLEHPTHALRFHCIACQQVTCRECMWRGPHRGHSSEGASGAGKRATSVLIAALQRSRTLLNSLLIGYNNRSFSNDERTARPPSTYYYYYYYYYYYLKNNRNSDEWPGATEDVRSRSTLSSYAREAQERIHEFARLQKARYLLDAISLGEELVAEGSDVEILSLSRIILKRLQVLSSDCDNETMGYEASDKFQDSRMKHSGVFHCCTFCSSGGKKEATCACKGTMPGGYKGCGHGHPGHPRVHHWSCCGSTDRHGCCLLLPKLHYQLIL